LAKKTSSMTVMTTKRKVLFYIPLAIVTCILLYTWYILLFGSRVTDITNYLGLILFIPVLYFLYKDGSCKRSLVVLGIYLLLATFNLVNIFPFRMSGNVVFSIGPLDLPTPQMNFFSVVILIVYLVLNLGSLMENYLDYKESKGEL